MRLPAHSAGPTPAALTYDPNNVFARILRKEVPAQVLHEDEHCLAFRDAAPQAPTHFLVVPKRPIRMLADAGPGDAQALGHLLLTAAAVAKQQGVGDRGFRVAVVADATYSPGSMHDHGLRRIAEAGGVIVHAKGVYYEWLRTLEAATAFRKAHPDLEEPPGFSL